MRFWMAWRFLIRNKSRALFPLGGVIIGAMALIMTLSLGSGGKKIIEKDLGVIGENRILVGGTSLTEKDKEIIERLPFVQYVMFPEMRSEIQGVLYRGYTSKGLITMGLPLLQDNEVILDEEQFQNIRVGDIISLETKNGKREFIIKDLYKEVSPFERVRIGKRVIVKDSFFEKLFGKKEYKSLVISFPQGEQGEDYIPLILRELNRSRFSHNQIKLLETPEVYKKVEKIKIFVNKSLYVLSFISLIVGGFGIMNLIGSSVRDRKNYIGILRAVGMDQKKIFELFILEGVLIIFLGTILGVFLGVLNSWLVGAIIKIPPVFSFKEILISLFVTMIVGVVFGTIPAKKAGKLEIIEALKI